MMHFIAFTILLASISAINGQESATLKENILPDILNLFGYSPSCTRETLSQCHTNKLTANCCGSDIKHLLKAVTKRPKNCADIFEAGDEISGLKIIFPYSCDPEKAIDVVCNQILEGEDQGGWTVIQNRNKTDVREDFFRSWIEYVLGFGNLNREFWLGLENIHAIVNQKLMKLRVYLEDHEGGSRIAQYNIFHVAGSDKKYQISIGKYSGTAGDAMSEMNKLFFSTSEEDNDSYEANCASAYKGGWWYGKCHSANLNGFQHEGHHKSYADGINWRPWRGYNYSLKVSTMSVKPVYSYARVNLPDDSVSTDGDFL